MLAVLVAGTAAAEPRHVFDTGITPRHQWNANSGYCGETSVISAGLHFGQYTSQWTARALASPGLAQCDPASQLLLGVNDIAATERMRLLATRFYLDTQQSTDEFLDWVKSQTLRGRIVAIGVFNNGVRLDEWTRRRDGDSLYDHIVPVLRIASHASLERWRDTALPRDVVTISDNGLYGPVGDPPAYPFYFSRPIDRLRGTRRQANRPHGPLYLLRKRPPNYGLAIEGPLDLDGVTVPVRLVADRDDEPPLAHGATEPPPPAPLRLTATVSIADQSVAHVLYRYDDFAAVPVAGFNAAAGHAVSSWLIPAHSGPTFTVEIDTHTGATVALRAVPVTAP